MAQQIGSLVVSFGSALHRLTLGLARTLEILAAQSAYIHFRKPAEPGITFKNRLFTQIPLAGQRPNEMACTLPSSKW